MKLLLGITGSVAATLTPKLVNALQLTKDDLSVVLTNRAEYFMSTGMPAHYNLDVDLPVYNDHSEWVCEYHKGDEILHIKLAQESDILIIAPLSANTIAKIANGICDNLLTSTVRAWGKKPMILAPAMNTEMWRSPFTKAHLKTIQKVYNVRIVQPVSKMLACGQEGMGAMAEIGDIVATKDCVKVLLQCAAKIGKDLDLNE